MGNRMFSAVVAAIVVGTTSSALAGSSATIDNPGGGHILTATLGAQMSLQSAAAAMLQRIHTQFGARPTVVQVVQNTSAHSLALLFTESEGGQSFTGVSFVNAVPGAQAGGAALYDTTARFHTTVGPLVQRLQSLTSPGPSVSRTAPAAPAEPLIQHAFPDGTGSIGVPADWKLTLAGGGSATAVGPTGEIVSYNVASPAIDPNNQAAIRYLNGLPPQIRNAQMGNTALLPYTGDPVRAWTTMFSQVARQHGKQGPSFTVTSHAPAGKNAAEISGEGINNVPITYVAYVAVLPPNGMGQWTMDETFVVVPKAEVAREGATAAAILQSVRINFGAFAAQGAAIRQMFQRQFDAMIANGERENEARQRSTDQALASDRATQEGMHKQAVSMENFSLDRAVVVNQRTGAHSTIDSNFADVLVQGNSNYQKVPANQLLRGVDY
jgi:hypothetical protein